MAIFIAYPQYSEFMEKNNIPNLNWNWNIEFITEESSKNEYIWINDKYDVFFIWSKDNYIWKGEKWNNNWKIIHYSNRDKIEFNYFINKNNFYWFYTLYWSREVTWNLEAVLNKDWNYFEGTFTISAANSKWRVIGIKKED